MMTYFQWPAWKTRNKPSSIVLSLILLSIILAGCASRPQLYPNKKFTRVGEEKAETAIDGCMEKADALLDSPTGKKMLRGAGTGAIAGAAFGTVIGLFTGNVGRGAASGATAGAVGGALSPDQVRYRYV